MLGHFSHLVYLYFRTIRCRCKKWRSRNQMTWAYKIQKHNPGSVITKNPDPKPTSMVANPGMFEILKFRDMFLEFWCSMLGDMKIYIRTIKNYIEMQRRHQHIRNWMLIGSSSPKNCFADMVGYWMHKSSWKSLIAVVHAGIVPQKMPQPYFLWPTT